MFFNLIIAKIVESKYNLREINKIQINFGEVWLSSIVFHNPLEKVFQKQTFRLKTLKKHTISQEYHPSGLFHKQTWAGIRYGDRIRQRTLPRTQETRGKT